MHFRARTPVLLPVLILTCLAASKPLCSLSSNEGPGEPVELFNGRICQASIPGSRIPVTVIPIGCLPWWIRSMARRQSV